MATVHAAATDAEAILPWSGVGQCLAVGLCGNDADEEEIILVEPPDVPLTGQERKRVAHMLRNRESAKRSREHRKEHIADLEARVLSLLQEIQDLKNKCKNLEVDNKEREYYNKYYS